MRRRLIGRILLGVLALLIAVPLIAAGGGYLWWRQGLPKLDGEVKLNGLKADVRVIRDKHGVPHIFANDIDDAARALGYLHA
ncbi:MAG TPA: penicillin acylase family protein, partial [Hyphomicrobiales bacterium]